MGVNSPDSRTGVRDMSPGRPYRRRNKAFHCAIAGVLIVLVWVPAGRALALTQQDIDWCLGKNATPDSQVNGCTAVIQSGKAAGNDLASAYQNRGLAHVKRGDFEVAIADFTEAIRLNPQSAKPYNDRGFSYARRGDLDHAIADYDQAVRLDPRYSLALRNRGLAYLIKHEYDRAIADYDAAIRIDPKDIAAYIDRGNVYHVKGDLDGAIADFDEAIRLDPSLAPPYTNRCYAYYHKGDQDRSGTSRVLHEPRSRLSRQGRPGPRHCRL